MDQDEYPIYRRRNNGQAHIVRGKEVDNRDIVPYNAYLSKRFNCHINVEVCAGMRCVKCIHKYIYKGYDRITMVLGLINEIQQYLDARYIGPPEAAWRIFGYPLHAEIPTVVRLALHLPGMHRVLFNPDKSLEAIVSRAGQQMSTLTEKRWKPRQQSYAIGRMYFASPNCGERFYLHLLLTVVKGPKSFQCLRTVNNVLHDTFKLACVARGLLEDDEEWIQCLKEAAVMKTGYQLRRLLTLILTQLIFKHQQLHNEAQQADAEIIIDRLNNDQRTAYDAITSSVFENKGTIFFLKGGAGTGKTFLYNAVALKCRSLGHIVITVASSGIASLLLHRHCVEAVDRTLRDTCDSEKPFGGITVLLGGDFRQILPVITKGVREQIIETNPREIVKLPSTIHKCQDLKDIISVVYPQLDVAMTSTATFLTERTILSTRNDDVSAINTVALNIFPGSTHTYLAADKMSEDDEIDHPPGLPAFKVELKMGCPIILLRNIAPKNGLCNGTRLMVSKCNTHIVEAQILTGEKCGNLVFIPKISLTPSSSEMPFQMTRRQFPVRLAYALTINKFQGQSVKFVGVDLRTPVFSHGQLYVALSRCTSFDRISVILPNDEPDSTTNIVYPEILL
ncbi:ATP-dependent DNA helicase PIF7-like [Camellia sinensis]|uniref:ATP-dependent DNA helicase PIF7-like n=1 Tax=Camellia sinensis TaxID=4442 RepID=UPI00103616CC|nr:ATP-dependent DNA helicase PIF7-like [Camellia sinensis]